MTRDYIISRKLGEGKFHGFKNNASIPIINAAQVQKSEPRNLISYYFGQE